MPRLRAILGSRPLTKAIDHRSLMLCCTHARPFQRDGWTWEVKMDGFRMLAYRIGRETRLLSRNGNELGAQFPEIIDALSVIRTDCILDGELTVADTEGKPDWHALRPRSAMKRPESIRAAAVANPATLYLFDILARGKRDLRPATLASRRGALEEIVQPSSFVRIAGNWPDGPALFKSVTSHRLEGVVGKRLDAPYVAGRSEAWLKVRAATAREQSRR